MVSYRTAKSYQSKFGREKDASGTFQARNYLAYQVLSACLCVYVCMCKCVYVYVCAASWMAGWLAVCTLLKYREANLPIHFIHFFQLILLSLSHNHYRRDLHHHHGHHHHHYHHHHHLCEHHFDFLK
jgi:hypothetical protein